MWIILDINYNHFYHTGKSQELAGAWYVFGPSKPHSRTLWLDIRCRVDSLVAINNLPHFGVLTQGGIIIVVSAILSPSAAWSGYVRCVLGTLCMFRCVLVFVWSMSHLISPAWHFMISCARLQKNRQTSATSYPGKTTLAACWCWFSARHIYPLFDVGFNVSTALQHDVISVQMFIM